MSDVRTERWWNNTERKPIFAREKPIPITLYHKILNWAWIEPGGSMVTGRQLRDFAMAR